MELSTEDYIQHFGVKGMKWGVRNRSDAPKAPSRRQLKKAQSKKEREDRLNAGIKKAEALTEFAAKNQNNSLMLLNGRQVLTGKEFVDHMTNGGFMNVNTTRVYAVQKTKNGPYELQE